MSEKIVQLNEEIIKGQLKELVRESVEETLNELLEKEAESLTQAARYERSEARQGYRSGHYDRNLTTTSGDVTLHMPRLKGVSFETAIIERYRRRESSVEEALIEMYLAGVSVRRVEDITEALWGSKVSPATISELNKKAYVHIEDWRNRPLQGGRYPYVYVDGIYLRRNWGGEYENVAILVAIAVNEDGFREVLGAAEGMKEDKASWVSFFQWLRGRGLDGVKLIVGDKCMGMLEAVGEAATRRGYPVGLQEIHEYEAPRGGSVRRLYCRLTSLSRSLQTILRINLDGTWVWFSQILPNLPKSFKSQLYKKTPETSRFWRFPFDFVVKSDLSALGELGSATGGLQTVFLTLLHTRIAGQEAGLLQDGAVLGVHQQQGAADAVTQGAGLTGNAAAFHGSNDIHLAQGIGGGQGLTDDHLQGLQTEVLVDIAAVDGDIAGTVLKQMHAGNGGLAAAGAVLVGILGLIHSSFPPSIT